MTDELPPHETGSGNVFADLGFPNSAQELLKAELTYEIYRIVKDRGLTESEAAKILGTTQPQVSTLMRCRPSRFSVGRLLEFLTALDRDVEIVVRPRASGAARAKLSVVAGTG